VRQVLQIRTATETLRIVTRCFGKVLVFREDMSAIIAETNLFFIEASIRAVPSNQMSAIGHHK